MAQPWIGSLSPDDVFSHPEHWVPVSRSIATTIAERVPVVIVDRGSRSATFLDRTSPDLNVAFAGHSYFRYTPPVPNPARRTIPQAAKDGSQANAPVDAASVPKHWIKVVVVDEWDAPVSGYRLRLVFSNGAIGGGTTGADGTITQLNVPPGACKVTLQNNLFYRDDSKTGTFVAPAESDYTFKVKDTLSGIAHANGVEDGRTLYYYAKNDALRSSRAALGLVDVGDAMTVPKSFVYEFPTKPIGEDHEHKLKVPALLDIQRVDDHFAPSKENLDIVCELRLLASQTVKLEITSAHYPGNKVLERELEAGEKADGVHTFTWDGKATIGELKDKFIHPLFAPYRVKIYVDAKHTDEREFKVLYDSLVLQQGPWTHDEVEPADNKSRAWAAFKLNELGYWGGPVGKEMDKYLEKAVRRYKANHEKFWKLVDPDIKDTIDDDLRTALAAGEKKRPFFTGNALEDSTKESLVLVESITYQQLGKNPNNSEWGSTRAAIEKKKISRPLIPLEVAVRLRSKNDKPVLAPEGVGPVRIDWKWTDPPADTTDQFADTATEPSKTKRYVEKSLKVKGGGPAKDNAPESHSGIRGADAKYYKAPFVLGDSYEPHVVEDEANVTVFTKACVDVAKYPKRVGTAGVFFRPSHIGGDDYQLSAEIDFKGLPNKADLEAFHGMPGAKIEAKSGVIRIRRFGHLGVVVQWPGRVGSSEWDKVRDEMKAAQLDFDVSKFVSKPIADVITEAEYKAIVTKFTKHKNPAKITFKPDTVCGVDLPTPRAGTTLSGHLTNLRTFVQTDFFDMISVALGAKITENLRTAGHTGGHIALEFKPHLAVDLSKHFTLDRIKRVRDAAIKDPTTLWAEPEHMVDPAKFETWVGSIGLTDGTVLIDVKDPGKIYYLNAHEIGHTYFLLHHENTASPPNPIDHDPLDHNCLMTYSVPKPPANRAYQQHKLFTPHFCGKCNMMLRGWGRAGLPANSS